MATRALAGLLASTLVGASAAVPLVDARLETDGPGFRLTGRLDLGPHASVQVEARYAQAFEAADSEEVTPAPRAIPSPGSWLLSPPTAAAPAGAGILVPGERAGGRRRVRTGDRGGPPGPVPTDPTGDASPWSFPLPGARSAVLRPSFDSRMVEQRLMPPHLSQPFELEVVRGGATWTFAYQSRGEAYLDHEPVEDAVSRPVLAAWYARDAEALRATGLVRVIQELLEGHAVLARRVDAEVHELTVTLDRAASRPPLARPGLFHLPGPPRPFTLGVGLRLTEQRAFVDVVQEVKDVPAQGARVEVSSESSRSMVQARGVADAAGRVELRVDTREPGRLRLTYWPVPGDRDQGFLQLAWRWGRPQEAWLDRGPARFPAAAPARDEVERLRTMVASLFHAYSPDDGLFHDGTSTGLPPDLAMGALIPARKALGGELPPAPKGLEEGRLALDQLVSHLAAAFDPGLPGDLRVDRAPGRVPEVPAFESLLGTAEEALGRLGPQDWSLRTAAAASTLAHWATQDPRLPPGVEARAWALVASLGARSEHGAVPRGEGPITRKGGDPEWVPAPHDAWLGHLFLAHALRVGSIVDPALRPHADRERDAVRQAPLPDEVPVERLGLAARYLRVLVDELGQDELGLRRKLMAERVWSSYVRGAESLQATARLQLLQAYVGFAR